MITPTTPSPSRLVVLLFTDVVGSTDLKSQLGTAAYAPLAARHDEIFRGLVARFPGAEILKDLGDGFMARFETASQAVQAALLFQHAMATESWQSAPLRVRIGLHLGEVTDVGVDVSGKPKIVGLAADLAARLMSLALPGQILQTRTAFDDARQYVREHPPVNGSERSPLVVKWVAHGPYVFKGADDPLEVFEVGAEGIAPLQPPPDNDKARRAVRIDEEETLGWRPAVGLEVPGRPHWKLQRELGAGGFGEVWLAAHDKTHDHRVFKFCFDINRLRSFRRELTLFRLLRETLGERQDIARLHEVQLEHPPYYLESEFSELGNLADWAEKQGGAASIDLKTRLDIVRDTAEAVAAAHSVGVLHKDIKPSNILMYRDQDGQARPRICDFGIGVLTDLKQLQGRDITVAGFTVTQMTENSSSRTGTQMYAPPESMLGRAFSVQGDVYALGVVLFQMAVGDLRRPLSQGWEYSIADPLLREDIGACVCGDPANRLASAKELADRLAAIPQRRRAARRRRLLRASASAAVLALVLLGITALLLVRERSLRRSADESRDREVSSRKLAAIERDRAMTAEARAMEQLRRAQEAEQLAAADHQRALAEAEKAAAITSFFQMMLESVDPSIAKGEDLTVREVVDRAAESVGEVLKDQPEVQAAIRYTLGRVYFGLSDYAKSEQQMQVSFDMRRQKLGEDHQETMHSADVLAAALLYQGKLDAAEVIARDNLERRTRVLGPEHDQTLASMGRMAWVHQDRGRLDEAAALHRESLEIKKRVLGAQHAETLESMASFADVLEDMGRLDEAESVARQAVEATTHVHGPDDPRALGAQSVLASILQDAGKYPESEAIARSVLAARVRLLGEDHRDTLTTMNVLALTLESQQKYQEQADILRRAHQLSVAKAGENVEPTLTYLANLGRAEHLLKHHDEAHRILRRVLDARLINPGPLDVGTLVTMNNLGLLLLDMNKPEEAEPLFAQLAEGVEKALSADHWMVPAARFNVGECQAALKRYDQAEKTMLEAYERMNTLLGGGHSRVTNAARSLADLYKAWGKSDQEQVWRSRAAASG